MCHITPHGIPGQVKVGTQNRSVTSKKLLLGTSLVVQWLIIRLLVQGTQIQSLAWEDPTYHGATMLVRHNY